MVKTSSVKTRTIPAAEFKAKCLKLMDDVANGGQAIIITKFGKPIALLSPAVVPPKTLFGFMAGAGSITGDIVAPLDVAWDADRQT